MSSIGLGMLATTPEAANALETALAAAGLRAIARVNDSRRATDFAVALPAVRLAVIRCVMRPTPADHTALATMVTEGDFTWSALICAKSEDALSGQQIETFHFNELDRLVARLREIGGIDEAR